MKRSIGPQSSENADQLSKTAIMIVLKSCFDKNGSELFNHHHSNPLR
jgi:hypothetical protein